MSVQAVVAKSSGTIIFVSGVPTSIYFSWDHITLYEVERQVIDTDLKLTVGEPSSSSPKTIEITAPGSSSSENPKLSGNYSWSCVITLDSSIDNNTSNLKTKLQDNLYKDNKLNEKQKQNKEALVRACSKIKDPSSNPMSSSVKGVLTLKLVTGENNKKSFLFEKHPELQGLLEGLTAT